MVAKVAGAEIGEVGNVVMPGHRTTESAPFALLDMMQIGDPIYVTTAAGQRLTYVAEAVFIVPNSDWEPVIYPEGHAERATISIYGCHPQRDDDERIVVRAVLLP